MEVGVGGALHTEATVLGAESNLISSEAGARADSIRSTQRQVSRYFLVHSLKLLKMRHLSLTWISPIQFRQLLWGSLTGIVFLQQSQNLKPGDGGMSCSRLSPIRD